MEAKNNLKHASFTFINIFKNYPLHPVNFKHHCIRLYNVMPKIKCFSLSKTLNSNVKLKTNFK